MARRAAGDGALFKRSDGYWVGGIELPPGPDGKRQFKRVVRKSRNDVINAVRDMRKDAALGQIATAPTTTVGKWLDYWQAEILPHRKIRPSTIASYRTTIRLHLTPNIGAKRLDKLSAAEVRALYTTCEGRIAQKCDQVLRLAVNAAVREGVVVANVMDRVDKPGHTPKPQHAFDAATSMHIIATAVATQGRMWGARWALGFVTGARESEVLGLEWDRVDLDAGTIDISRQLLRMQKAHGCGAPVDGVYPCGKVRSSFCPSAHWDFPPGMQWWECTGTLVWTEPKSRAGVRLIPLVPAMVDVLRSIADTGPNPHGLVFHHPDGSPITQDQDQRAWKELLIGAKVPHAPQHSIRHSTATLLLESGVDGHIVQSVIGHSDIAVTHGYQHVSLDLARSAWANLAALMPAVGQPE